MAQLQRIAATPAVGYRAYGSVYSPAPGRFTKRDAFVAIGYGALVGVAKSWVNLPRRYVFPQAGFELEAPIYAARIWKPIRNVMFFFEDRPDARSGATGYIYDACGCQNAFTLAGEGGAG